MCDIEDTGFMATCCGGPGCGSGRAPDLHAELDDAVNELVTAVEGLAHRGETEYLTAERSADETSKLLERLADVHDTTADTATIEAAADELKTRLGE